MFVCEQSPRAVNLKLIIYISKHFLEYELLYSILSQFVILENTVNEHCKTLLTIKTVKEILTISSNLLLFCTDLSVTDYFLHEKQD